MHPVSDGNIFAACYNLREDLLFEVIGHLHWFCNPGLFAGSIDSGWEIPAGLTGSDWLLLR